MEKLIYLWNKKIKNSITGDGDRNPEARPVSPEKAGIVVRLRIVVLLRVVLNAVKMSWSDGMRYVNF